SALRAVHYRRHRASTADWRGTERQELLNNRKTQNRVAQPRSERPTIARAAERNESLPSTRALLRGEAARGNKQTVLRTTGRDLQHLEPAFRTKYGWRMALEWQM